jgi:hypothetical protein
VKRFLTIMALLVLAVPTALLAYDTDNMHQLIPHYWFPDVGASGSLTERMCTDLETSSNGSIVIANPYPDVYVLDPQHASYDAWAAQQWGAAIDLCQEEGHNVILYIRTAYANTNPSGAAPIASVIDQIEAGYDLIPTLDGVFFDEVTGNYTGTAQDYYAAATNTVRDIGEATDQDLTVCNPGVAATTSWHLEPVGDDGAECSIVVVFEGTHSTLDSATFPSWVAAKDGDELAGLVHSTDAISDMQDACQDLKAAGIAIGYVTPNGAGNVPWLTFPGATYWAAERNDTSGCG